MKYHVSALNDFANCFQLSDLARDGSNSFTLITKNFEQAFIVPGIVTDESRDVGSQLNEPLHQMAANEAPCSGDDHFCVLPLHDLISLLRDALTGFPPFSAFRAFRMKPAASQSGLPPCASSNLWFSQSAPFGQISSSGEKRILQK